jgi:hypothetical protein
MEATGLACARFMDDWVVLAPPHWKLRVAICLVNRMTTNEKMLLARESRECPRIGKTKF